MRRRFTREALASGDYPGLNSMSMYQIYSSYPYLYQKIGHYLNLCSSNYKYTGFAVCNKSGTLYNICYGQDFMTYLTGSKAYTADEWDAKISEYESSMTQAINAYNTAVSALNSATATTQQAQSNLTSAQNKVTTCQKAVDADNQKLTEASNKVDSTWSEQDQASTALSQAQIAESRVKDSYDYAVYYLNNLPDSAHEWGTWRTVKSATTTEEGTQKANCVNCGVATTRATEKAAKDNTTVFPDVPTADAADHTWYSSCVYSAAELGLVKGYSTGNFGPADTLTRGQAAVILWRFFEGENAAKASVEGSVNQTGMADVLDGQYYTNAANWATSVGVINGKGVDGSRLFDPNGTITRQELCVIIANAAAKLNGQYLDADEDTLAKMPDAGDVSNWATNNVSWCLENGVINGADVDGTKYVQPQKTVTRAEMAAILTNAINQNSI